jgi:hypothetical protein
VGCDAIWCQKWTTYLSKGNNQSFLDDFTIFNDLSTQFEKLKKCFLKCKEFGISLNPCKCAFMVIVKNYPRFYNIFKKGSYGSQEGFEP